MSLEKNLDAISEADLRELIQNRISEKRTLDYKLTLPGRSDGDRKEFLADVSSFGKHIGRSHHLRHS